MAKRFLLSLTLSIAVNIAFAQTVSWANEVLEFSSQLTTAQYSANQILGKPNVLPKGGENPNAWTPAQTGKEEFIKVGFESSLQIKQIAIAESYHPSAIQQVFVYDESGNEFLVGEFEGGLIPIEGRMLTLFYETDFKVSAVKIVLDGSLVDEYFSIDAVAISDSDIPIVAEVEVPEYLSEGVEVKRLSEKVNSDYKELKPVLSPDGNTLYFSRQNHPENIGGVKDTEDIWYSVLDDSGEWMEAQNIGPTLNTDGPNFISSLTPDGNSLIMTLGNKYLDNGEMEAGVSVSTNVGGNWTQPVALEIENEYNLSPKANFYLANSRRTLLMSVQREDSYGDRDLYVSFMKDDSVWTEPLNLGDIINTAGTESSPFLAADDKTLYFASNGFSGYGGMDIYTSKRLDETWTNWSDPQNMGPEINSEFEDLFFVIKGETNEAYYSRGVDESNTDIFQITLPVFQRPDPVIVVRGKLIDSKTGEPIEAIINYERLSDGKDLGMILSDPETGEFKLLLPAGEEYGIYAESEGYLSQSDNIDLRNFEGQTYETAIDNIKLVPIEAEAQIELNNIFFNLESAILREESYAELNRLVELLQDTVIKKVKLVGHTDTTGVASYNQWLSEKRAESVYNYLKQQGISEERMMTEAYGETRPKYDNATREGRQKNRRVEFVIIEK